MCRTVTVALGLSLFVGIACSSGGSFGTAETQTSAAPDRDPDTAASEGDQPGDGAATDGPSVERMVLELEDLPDGSEVYGDSSTESNTGVMSYGRSFSGPGLDRVGESALKLLHVEAWLFDQAGEAGSLFAYYHRQITSEYAHPAVAADVAEELGVEPVSLTVMGLEGSEVGDRSIGGRVVVDIESGQLDIVFYYVWIDRVLEVVSGIGLAGNVHQEDIHALAEKMAARTEAELATY